MKTERIVFLSLHVTSRVCIASQTELHISVALSCSEWQPKHWCINTSKNNLLFLTSEVEWHLKRKLDCLFVVLSFSNPYTILWYFTMIVLVGYSFSLIFRGLNISSPPVLCLPSSFFISVLLFAYGCVCMCVSMYVRDRDKKGSVSLSIIHVSIFHYVVTCLSRINLVETS